MTVLTDDELDAVAAGASFTGSFSVKAAGTTATKVSITATGTATETAAELTGAMTGDSGTVATGGGGK